MRATIGFGPSFIICSLKVSISRLRQIQFLSLVVTSFQCCCAIYHIQGISNWGVVFTVRGTVIEGPLTVTPCCYLQLYPAPPAS
ncbi:hypothetical protein F4824DRAFT_484528 [Ustulina deusta]|nr:hypothetical protein F4824DRAFT_484528 [Ustulina deusta]